MNSKTCPVCGCRVEGQRCQGCGTAVQTEDDTLRLARDHLKVGNYAKVKGLISPMLEKTPAEPALYDLLARAATDDLADLLLDDESRWKEAGSHFEKLRRLKALRGETVRYFQRREKALEARRVRRRRIVFLEGGSALALLALAALLKGFAGLMLVLPALAFGALALCTALEKG